MATTKSTEVLEAPKPLLTSALLLSLIDPSPTNPRKTEDDRTIVDLAESMQGPAGLIQPISVRLKEKGRYEIISGHRRVKAAKHLGWKTIDAIVRNVSDDEILEIQIIENLQREDVNAMDEAQAFLSLLQKESIDWLCSKIHKSKKYVQDRLKLNDLVQEGRELVSAGVLPLTHALMITKLPQEEQRKCVEKCADEDYRNKNDEMVCVLTVNELKHYIEDDLMIEFEGACFDPGDAELVPEAGACATCPKRTCNQNLLFQEITDSDMCTDAKCFHEKEEAHVKKSLKEAKEEFGKERVSAGQFERYAKDKVKFKGVSLSYSDEPKKDTDICVVITKSPDSFNKQALGKKVYVDSSKLKRTITAKENGTNLNTSRSSGKSWAETQWEEFRDVKIPRLEIFPAILSASDSVIKKIIRPTLRSYFNNLDFKDVAGAAHALGLFEPDSSMEEMYKAADKIKFVDQTYWYDQIIDAIGLENTPKILLALAMIETLDCTMKARPEAARAKNVNGGLYWSEIVEILKPKPAVTKKAAAKPEKKASVKKLVTKKAAKKK